jgi:uncharacterized membrane protein
MKPSVAYIILLGGCFLWCAVLFLPPLLASEVAYFPQLSDALYRMFSKICHQDDARSFHLLGHKLAVCIRCSSIYLSFLFGVLFVPLFSCLLTKKTRCHSEEMKKPKNLFFQYRSEILHSVQNDSPFFFVSLNFSPTFFFALTPMVIDVFFDFVGIHASNDWTRCLTGSLFGFISAVVLTPSFIEAFSQLFSSHIIQGVSHESQTQ